MHRRCRVARSAPADEFPGLPRDSVCETRAVTVRTIRYVKSEGCMIRDGYDPTLDQNWIAQHRATSGFFESLDHMAPVSLASLRRALRAASEADSSLVPSRYIDLDAV